MVSVDQSRCRVCSKRSKWHPNLATRRKHCAKPRCISTPNPRPGKLEIVPIKPLSNQRDLALAYSPGVAAPCEEIAADPDKVDLYTSRANLVAVISNGTAVLGLGNIGALASKPVMEGKAVLFKKFAGIDSIDIEVDETDAKKFIEVVRRSSRPSAASISRTSRRRTASRSRKRCAPA